ncbi:hypothetical protein JTE90_016189 [Oedothorax gibbosus]|uniref:Phosphoinositide phospholipase C n=1 Tax=Oedothorax gibbosus TaxID=931172 RepID=A0AAV6U7M5_9ARAC|nr:hypothetical protein JTE90_016189 [Oedothorax gibbosus]
MDSARESLVCAKDAGLDLERVLLKLEQGTDLLEFYLKRKPEMATLCVRLETREILLWESITGRKFIELTVDLRQVKEVRHGKNSKDFERYADETKKYNDEECFVLVYGDKFTLRTLSCAGPRDECQLWVRGIEYLVAESRVAPYPLLIERYLRKEFYSMVNLRGVLTIKYIKAFLPKINMSLPTNRLKELLQDVDFKSVRELGVESFVYLYRILVHDQKLFTILFGKYTTDGKNISGQEFKTFLFEKQMEPESSGEENIIKLIVMYLQDIEKGLDGPLFTIPQFLDYLFSEENDAFDPEHNEINQDMNQSMVNYWIASSHNTYLLGDQWRSESSCEAYARCLRMGCRCIELDCWDGPDGVPLIFHGHSLTSRIKFMDVLKTIKEHAFVTSQYPVILSLEDNCSLPQQKSMATAFIQVFGDMLLTQPVEGENGQMPSPEQLKRKIILKHKKLPDDQEDQTILRNDEVDPDEAIKTGILYLEDPINGEWRPYLFTLSGSRVYYEEYNDEEDEDDEEDPWDTQLRKTVPSEELHVYEKWFHGQLQGGRTQAEKLLQQYAFLGDGAFLVRRSDTYVGDYSLSFWRQNEINHCHICARSEEGATKYYIINTNKFDSLYSLISHYQSNELRTSDFCICLTEPVPQPNKHEGEEWFISSITRVEAEEMLKKVQYDGAFLVRPSEKEPNSFAISFRAENKIRHCRISFEDHFYAIGTAQFENLPELVNYYEKHTLYRNTKLKYPINKDILIRIAGVTVIAECDFVARKFSELSFPKDAIITNVRKQSEDWWKGDYGGKLQRYFLASFVREIEAGDTADNTAESMPGKNCLKGSLDIAGCCVEITAYRKLENFNMFRILSPKEVCPLEIAATSIEEMMEWIHKIWEVVQSGNITPHINKEEEESPTIAKELSDLIIYFRSVPFNRDKIGKHTEMSSFAESKMEKNVAPGKVNFFVNYHRRQFSRVYPKGTRLNSSNYDPVRMWNAGVQMAALNYQTPDRATQLNHARFMQNGRCGYVLKPKVMFNEDFDPYERSTLHGVNPLSLSIQIMSTRYLMKTGKGLASPFIEVEIVGSEYDNCRFKGSSKEDEGSSMAWKEPFTCTVYNPEVAIIKFIVQYEDMFSDPKFLALAAYPVPCLRPGYRSIALKNKYCEPLELSCLLAHIEIKELSPESISLTDENRAEGSQTKPNAASLTPPYRQPCAVFIIPNQDGEKPRKKISQDPRRCGEELLPQLPEKPLPPPKPAGWTNLRKKESSAISSSPSEELVPQVNDKQKNAEENQAQTRPIVKTFVKEKTFTTTEESSK